MRLADRLRHAAILLLALSVPVHGRPAVGESPRAEVRLTGVTQKVSAARTTGAGHTQLQVTVELQLEVRCRPGATDGVASVDLLGGRDDRGRDVSLAAPPTIARSGDAWSVRLPLGGIDPAATRLRQLEGFIFLLPPASTHLLRVRLPVASREVSWSDGPVTLRDLNLRRVGSHVGFEASLVLAPGRLLIAERAPRQEYAVLRGSVVMDTASGAVRGDLEVGEPQEDEAGAAAAHLRLQPMPAPAEPRSLELAIPVRVARTLEAPFGLPDISLPLLRQEKAGPKRSAPPSRQTTP